MGWFGNGHKGHVFTDPVCPECGTEGCHYHRDGNKPGEEIWLCENGHTFTVTIR